jgi:hypothetical protein
MKDMKFFFICTFLLTSVFTSGETLAEAQLSNCDPHEKIFFSCSTGKKIISLCSSPNNNHPAYLEYRFGSPKNIELRHKVAEDVVNIKFRRANILGASGESTEIWFSNNEISYVLGDPAKGNATLEIVQQKKVMARFICKKDFAGDTSMSSDLIEEKTSNDFFKLYGN